MECNESMKIGIVQRIGETKNQRTDLRLGGAQAERPGPVLGARAGIFGT